MSELVSSRSRDATRRAACRLARRLGLPVTEVGVRAEERDGSKVQLAMDALRMLGDVLILARWAATGAYDLPDRPVPELAPGSVVLAPGALATGAGGLST